MSIYRALQATRFLPSFTGAAPYRLSSSSIKFSRIGLLWPFIQLPGYAVQLYFARAYVPLDNVEIKTFILTSASWIEFITGIYGIVKDGLCQKNLVEIVRLMDNYDKKSGYTNDKGKLENERIRLWNFAYSAAIVVTALVLYLSWRSIHYHIVMAIVNILINNAVHMFVVLTILLGLRLRHLNSIVIDSRVTTVDEKGASSESFDPGRPECFRELYTSLHATGELLNNHYSDRLLLWSAFSMASFLRQIYVLITEKISTTFILALIAQLIPVILGLLLYCAACQFTVGQVNTKRLEALAKIIRALLEKNIRHTARINRGRMETFTMGLYMALQPFEFTALGFFSVDFSLTFAIVATTSAYVILSIQAGGN